MFHFSIFSATVCSYMWWCQRSLMSSTEVLHKQPVAEYVDPFKIWETAGL